MRVFRNPKVMWRQETHFVELAEQGLREGTDVEDVATAVLLKDGTMVSLNLLGMEVWKRCDGRSVEEIVQELQGQFDVESQMLREDVVAFLKELKALEFVSYEE
jgi:GeoRSP system PqqD family protein